MTDNILKKRVERTAKELVAEVYPADKPYRDVADAVPVYVRIARGRRSKGELLDAAIEAVKKVVGENGWFAVDRGMDSVEFVFFMKRRDFLGVVRVNKMDRDVFGTGRTIDADFAKVPYVKAELQTYRGTVKARVKWKPGVFTDNCGSQTKVLVVESSVGGHPIWLYVTRSGA